MERIKELENRIDYLENLILKICERLDSGSFVYSNFVNELKERNNE